MINEHLNLDLSLDHRVAVVKVLRNPVLRFLLGIQKEVKLFCENLVLIIIRFFSGFSDKFVNLEDVKVYDRIISLL